MGFIYKFFIVFSDLWLIIALILFCVNSNLILFFIIKKENIWLYTFYFILLLVFDLWIVDLMLDYLIALIY